MYVYSRSVAEGKAAVQNTVYTKSNKFAWLSDAQEISLFKADTVQVAAGQESVGQ